MLDSYLPLADPSLQVPARRFGAKVQALVALLFGFGLGCVVLLAAGGQPLELVMGIDTVSMAARSMQLATNRQAMLPANRARNVMQQAQAPRSSFAGLFDSVVPVEDDESKKPAEFDIPNAVTKREIMAAAAAAALTFRGQPAFADELQTYTDSRYGISFGVPSGWSEAAPQDRPPPGMQRLVVSTDPKDASNNIFVSFTALRPDVTGLGSFGSLDEFSRTIIPQCNGAPCSFENGDPVDAKVVSSQIVKGSWAYDYTLEQKGAPKRHLRSLFQVKQEAGSTILISLNAQALEDNYAALATTFGKVLESFSGSS